MSGTITVPQAIMEDVPERILIGRDAELEELSSLLGVSRVGGQARGVEATPRQHVLLAGDAGGG